jgi:rubrerythrin
MTNGQQATGTRDESYNLVSVLYHALQAAETYQQYIDDARSAGDEDLAGFFSDLQEQDRQRADRAKQLLSGRLNR